MTHYRNRFLLALTAATGLAGAANADGFYGTGMLGLSVQSSDSNPYGNNIAVDPDFPADFSTGDGVVGAVGLGYDFGNNFRIESRLGFHRGEFSSLAFGTGARAGSDYVLDGEIESTTLTVEGFYDIPANTAITPYLKAGIGAARNDYSARLGGTGVAAFDAFDGVADGYYDGYADRDSTEFTWNVGFGASMPVSDRLTVFGEYQYVSLGDASTGQDAFTDGFRVDADAHEFMIGLRAEF